ncbi:MAG: hypothetical protein RAO92_00655 [Candidatus Euphemobacter frigidus]|nr:hypothetical protein [Candidatus Euphemobacter frigidus]MDP8274888.1 hypothetical protein [Candidatus Euphemobacter frigidus]
MKTVDLRTLAHVARRFHPLNEKFAFIGGAIIPLLLDEPLVTAIRPTKDIDIIIEIVSRLDYFSFEERVRALGFKHDMSEGAPKCRWIVDGIVVDVMPVSGEAAEWRSKWFPEALATSVKVELNEEVTANVITAPLFIATKLDAFFDRGHKDYYASPDLEDIITVLDGRSSIFREINDLPLPLHSYLSNQFAELIKDPAFIECLPGHLLPDTANQERLPLLLELLYRLSAIQE